MSPEFSPGFRLMWAGQSVSALGSQVTVLVLPLLAASTLNAGPVALGVLTASATVPYLILGLPAGVWIDRARRPRRLLVAADLTAAVAVTAIPVMAVVGALSVVPLVAAALVIGSCQVLHRIAFSTDLPNLVADDQLVAANSRLRASESVAQIGGPGLGGVLAGAVGASAALLVDAVSFVMSAVCISRVSASNSSAVAVTGGRGFLRDVVDGLNVVRRNPSLRAIAGSAANLNVAGSASQALLVLFAIRDLNMSPALLGAVLTAGGVGALLGALLAPHLVRRWGAGRTVVFATVWFSTCLAAIPAASGSPAVAATVLTVGQVCGGMAVTTFDTTIAGIVVRAVPLQILGRVLGTLAFLTQSAKPMGAVAGGLAGALFGLRPALGMAAVAATTCLAWTWFSPLRHDRPMAMPTTGGARNSGERPHPRE